MQSLSTKAVAMAVVLLATPSRAEPIARTHADATWVQEFDSLDREGQHRYLQGWLVERFDHAARIALSNTEREKRTQRYAEVLRRSAAGRLLSKSGLSRLITEIASVERQAIDQLSLQYRVLIYGRYRMDRAEYDRRMALWRSMMAAWEAADTRVSEGADVISWLATVLDRMRYDPLAVLPSTPEFGKPTGAQFAAKPESSEIDLPLPIAPPPTNSRQATIVPPIKLPATVAKPPAVNKPTSNLPASPRLVHRVDKPQIPEVSLPPREITPHTRPVVAPPETPHRSTEPEAELSVIVDLNELTVRVRGYNLALKEFTGNLQDERMETTQQLAEALDELSDLAERRTQLTLYRDLISRDEQQQVSELMSLDTPVALLGAKIYAVREKLSKSLKDDNSTAIATLNELSRKLALLAAKRAK